MDLIAQDSSTGEETSFLGEKVCKTCGETKHITEFIIWRGGITKKGTRTNKFKGNRSNLCKTCKKAQNSAYYESRKEVFAAKAKISRAKAASYGSDEKFGETWKDLDAVLRNITYMRVTPLQKAA